MLKIIDTNTQTDGIAVDLGTTDDVLVLAGVKVENTHAVDQYDSAILGVGNDHSVDIHGIVMAHGMAINLGGSVTNHNNYVHVGASGYVASDAFFGIGMLGYNGVIRNEGTISGAQNGIAWWSDAGGSRSFIYNSGHIEGGQIGISLQLGQAVTVNNSGIIAGGTNALTSAGAGAIRLINNGLMQGSVSLGSGNDLYDGRDGEVDGQIDSFGGNDRLWGGEGDEIIFAGAGKDRINGGGGDDFASGGLGSDRLAGGEGLDNFYYLAANESGIKIGNRDLILDFMHADGDQINLTGIDANILTVGDDAFTFKGTAAFSGTPGEIRYNFVGDNTIVHVNIDGDLTDEMAIELVGKINLVAADFSL